MGDISREELAAKHRELLSNGAPNDPVRGRSLACAFECRDGWLPIIDAALTQIERALSSEQRAKFIIGQIKEKFANLRIYYYPHDSRIDAIIDAAQQHAKNTCETCGNLGFLYQFRGHFLARRCPRCAAELGESRSWSYELVARTSENQIKSPRIESRYRKETATRPLSIMGRPQSAMLALRLAKAATDHLNDDPEAMASRFVDAVRELRRRNGPKPSYDALERAALAGIDTLCALLLSEGDDADLVRSMAPFYAIIPEEERKRIIRGC